MALTVKPQNSTAVRSYINDYGKKRYGINDEDIGWDPEFGVSIGGKSIGLDTYFDPTKNTNYADSNYIKQSIDKYAKDNNLKDYYGPYASPYKDQTDKILDEILNAKPFDYDTSADPLFKNYSEQYAREGDRAFNNAIGDMSSLTGGRLNSWAVSGASQAQQNWSQKLMDKIPELRNIAYEMYRNDLGDKARNLGILSGLDNSEYNRFATDRGFNADQANFDKSFNYQKGVDDRNFDFQKSIDERNFGYQKETDDRNFNYQKGIDERNFNYQKGVDDRNFNYNVERDKILDERWMKQFTAEEQQRIIDNGIKNRQISIDEGNAMLNRQQFEWSKDPNNPDNVYKNAQISNMNSGGKDSQLSYKDYFDTGNKMLNQYREDENGQKVYTDPDKVKQWVLGLPIPDEYKVRLINDLGVGGSSPNISQGYRPEY